MEYCHRHDTPSPILIPAPLTPIFVRPPDTPHREMAQVHRTHTDVAMLAAQIAQLINEDNKDTIKVPAPPFIPSE